MHCLWIVKLKINIYLSVLNMLNSSFTLLNCLHQIICHTWTKVLHGQTVCTKYCVKHVELSVLPGQTVCTKYCVKHVELTVLPGQTICTKYCVKHVENYLIIHLMSGYCELQASQHSAGIQAHSKLSIPSHQFSPIYPWWIFDFPSVPSGIYPQIIPDSAVHIPPTQSNQVTSPNHTLFTFYLWSEFRNQQGWWFGTILSSKSDIKPAFIFSSGWFKINSKGILLIPLRCVNFLQVCWIMRQSGITSLNLQ